MVNTRTWAEIATLCDHLLEGRGSPLRTESLATTWRYHEGAGFESQAECDDLANRIESYVGSFGLPPDFLMLACLQEFADFLRACGGFQVL
jgi:hypothetical protein